jgi:hypothetical protein
LNVRFLLPRFPLCITLSLCLLGGALTGCQTKKKDKPLDYQPAVCRFFIEAGGDIAGLPVQLPLSGTQILVNPKPVFGEFDIFRADLVRADIGPALYIQLNPDATRDFYRFTLTNRGKRLVATFNGAPLGARLIDQPVANGAIILFLELPDTELDKLVERLNRTSQDMAREAAKARG